MTITINAPRTKTEFNRMGKAALLDWATQTCMLEHLTSEHAAALTKKELVDELLDVQLQREVFAEQASGATGEQVVVVSSTETHVDGKTVTVVARSDSWEEQRKAALAADRAARAELPAWKRLRSGHACSLCGKDGGLGGKYGAPLCMKHYGQWRALERMDSVTDSRAALVAKHAEDAGKPAPGKRTAKPTSAERLDKIATLKAEAAARKTAKASTSKKGSK